MTSSSSRLGGKLVSRRMSTTSVSKLGLRNWAGETLTETLIDGQARPSEQARRIVQRPSFVDQAGLLGDRHEDRWRHRAEQRAVPAQQRLDADDRPALCRKDRLVDEIEPVLAERAPQIVGDLQPLVADGVDHGVVDEQPVRALLLGLVHRHVGAAKQFLGRRIGGVGHRDADAGADRHRPAVELEGIADEADQPPTEIAGDLDGTRAA